MTLIKCPECSKEISDRATKCINCGHAFVEEEQPQEESQKCTECGGTIFDDSAIECPYCGCPIEGDSKVQAKIAILFADKEKIKLPLVGVVAALVIILFAALSCSGVFDADRQLATNVAKDYQSMLKNPESMTIRSDFTIVRYETEDGEKQECCYFEETSENGFGGNTSSTPVYFNGEYEIDAEGEYAQGSNDEILANGGKIATQFQWRMWQLEGFPEGSKVTTVDGEVVAKAIGVPCYK